MAWVQFWLLGDMQPKRMLSNETMFLFYCLSGCICDSIDLFPSMESFCDLAWEPLAMRTSFLGSY